MKEVQSAVTCLSGSDPSESFGTPFARAFYEELEQGEIYRIYRLTWDSDVAAEFYTSRSACESAVRESLQETYNKAQGYVTPGSPRCIASEAASVYGKHVSRCFTPVIDRLRSWCDGIGKITVFQKLFDLTENCEENLRTIFEKELTESADYYSMYRFDYFLEQTEIDTHDFRVSEGGLFRVLETLLADNVQYTVSSLSEPVCEMEKDLNEHAAAFFRCALHLYSEYIHEILLLLDCMGKGLLPREDGEDLGTYVDRVCVKNGV